MKNMYARIFSENERTKESIQTEVLKDFWESFDKTFDVVLQKLWEEYPKNFWLMSEDKREDFLESKFNVTFTIDLSKQVPKNDKNFVYCVKEKIKELFAGENFSIRCNAADNNTRMEIEILYFSIEKLIHVNMQKYASASNFMIWADKFKKRVSADKQKIEEAEEDVLNAKIDVLLDVFEESLKEVIADIFILGKSPSDGFIEMPKYGYISEIYPEAHLAFANVLDKTPFSLEETNSGTVIQCRTYEFKKYYFNMLQAALYEQDNLEQGEARKKVKPNSKKKSD